MKHLKLLIAIFKLGTRYGGPVRYFLIKEINVRKFFTNCPTMPLFTCEGIIMIMNYPFFSLANPSLDSDEKFLLAITGRFLKMNVQTSFDNAVFTTLKQWSKSIFHHFNSTKDPLLSSFYVHPLVSRHMDANSYSKGYSESIHRVS